MCLNLLKQINFRLFFVLIIQALIPSIYSTFRIYLLDSYPSASGINIASSFLTPRAGVAMSDEHQLPSIISKRNSKDVPYVAVIISVVLTAGTAFLLWLGDQITRKGIGNGLSLIIMAGIIATLPQMFIDAWSGLVSFDGTTQAIAFGIVKFIVFAIIYFAIIVGVIFVQQAERKVPIQYANKSGSYSMANASYVPIKVNTAGVVPVIFASSLLAIPGIIAGLINNESFSLFVQNYLTYTTPVGFLIYVIFIFLFGFVYTYMIFKPEEFAKNLQENGGYIPGIRPGDETKTYLTKILNRITCLGSIFLTIIVALPIIFSNLTSLPTSVSIGGTSLLIVVGVALETYKQIEGSLLSRNYKKGYKRR